MEELSIEDKEELEEALEDGFEDWSFPRNLQETISIGKAFETSPLFEVKLRVDRNGQYEDIKQNADNIDFSKDDDLFNDLSDHNFFISSPFGCNLKKLQIYFSKRFEVYMAEFGDELKSEPFLLEGESWDWDNEPFFDLPHFHDFILSKQYPFTKLWFEISIHFSILHLFATIKRVERIFAEYENPSQDPHFKMGNRTNFLSATSSILDDAGSLGRAIEHYRWKFMHEPALLKRASQSKNAGLGGG